MLVTFGPLVHSLSGKLGPIAFYRSAGANTIRTTHRYAVPPSALQSERRQAFSRCSSLWPHPNYEIATITQAHAVAADEPRWNHILSANLNNEIDASGYLPIPWDGTLDPLTGLAAVPAWAPGIVTITWDESPNDADDSISISIRKIKTAPDHFQGIWTPNATSFRERLHHLVNIYNLEPGVLYQFSLTPYRSVPYPFAKSVNATSLSAA